MIVTDEQAEARARADYERQWGKPYDELSVGARAEYAGMARAAILAERQSGPSVKATRVGAPQHKQKRVPRIQANPSGAAKRALPDIPGFENLCRAIDAIDDGLSVDASLDWFYNGFADRDEPGDGTVISVTVKDWVRVVTAVAALKHQLRVNARMMALLAGPALLKTIADKLEESK